MASRADYVYTADLDDDRVLESLRRIENRMEKLETTGQRGFNKVQKSASRFCNPLGLV